MCVTSTGCAPAVLGELVRSKLPALGAHLARIEVGISIFATDYFLCLFCTVMPAETAMRIWDSLLLEGPKVIYRVALVVLKVRYYHWRDLADTVQIYCPPFPSRAELINAHNRRPHESLLCLGLQENQSALLALDDAGLVLQHMKKAAAGAHHRDALMEVPHPTF